MWEIIGNIIDKLIEWGIYGFFILLPMSLTAPMLSFIWLKSKYKRGACNGDINHCKAEQMEKAINEIEDQIDTVKNYIHETYCQDIEEHLKQSKKSYTEPYIQSCKDLYGVIVDASFVYMERKLIYKVRKNHIPKSGSKKFDQYIEKLFNLCWNETWAYFDKAYSSLFILTIENRREANLKGKPMMKEMFRALFITIEDYKKEY
jgi:hypothetical protein